MISPFYKYVVGLELVPHSTARPHFDLGGQYLVILKGKPAQAQEALPERFPTLAFGVEDLDQAIEHLKAHGVDLPWGVEQDENSQWVMFHDPAGNLLEFVQFTQPELTGLA